jgi:pyruvate dehydrogenase E2 component (dihydrolipoamide acetyltransferase)
VGAAGNEVAQAIDIRVPDLGDFSEVEIIEVLVKAGDHVVPEDGLITLETDKAAMDVPATHAGEVLEITVAVGDKVSSGDVIGRLQPDGQGEESSRADRDAKSGEKETGSGQASAADADEDTAEVEAVDFEDSDKLASQPGGTTTLEVPDLGDFSDVDVIEVHVKTGDQVGIDDPLITLETDKAAMDVPATVAGRIESVLVKVGDKVSKGSQVATIEAAETPQKARPEAAKAPQGKPAAEAPQAETKAARPAASSPERQARQDLPTIDEAGFAKAHASPSVRRLARELGVDLVRVKGSGPKSRVLHDDLKAYVKSILTGKAEAPGAGGLPRVPQVDFAKFGDVVVEPLTRIQKIAAPRLQASWINLPHVTQHDLADITDLEAKRQALKGPAKERGISLTPLAFVMKACVAALREFPKANASLADDGQNIVYKHYCHLGFAADTEDGLVVPVIRDADKKDIYELAEALGRLSKAAREGKLKADQMQGASFTITSLGGIGGTAFTPIVNAPEVAILGVSRSTLQPYWNGSEFIPRLMLPLSLSYDHRVIDGAYAVRFTTFLCKALADVETLLEAIP